MVFLVFSYFLKTVSFENSCEDTSHWKKKHSELGARHVLIRWNMLLFCYLIPSLTKFMQCGKNICAFLSLLINFWIFAIIYEWGNNEVKCPIIKS